MISGKIGNLQSSYCWDLPGHFAGATLAFIWLGMIVPEARSHLDTSLEQIVSGVREVEAEEILDQLVNMIDDQRYPQY